MAAAAGGGGSLVGAAGAGAAAGADQEAVNEHLGEGAGLCASWQTISEAFPAGNHI